MKERLAFRVLSDLMKWSDEEAQVEFAWLRLMSRLKYDSYQGYLAGVRFIESLTTWLQQFAADERRLAYELVRTRLVYVSTPEIRHLVERFYPREVEPRLVQETARLRDIKPYRVFADEDATALLKKLRRKTLFIGLSDGARMDMFRRANSRIISNEQTVLAPLIDHDKWDDLRKELRKETLLAEETDPKFNYVYLIDDLTASGTTLIRFKEAEKKWKGKLVRFRDAIWKARDALKSDFPIADDCTVCVHHYVATQAALDSAAALDQQARDSFGADKWFKQVELSAGWILDDAAKVSAPEDDGLIRLTDKYYDPVLETRHVEESGIKNMRLGYKECALTLVLEHNTPNNSLSLLWAETEGSNGAHRMRALFRRRDRHDQ